MTDWLVGLPCVFTKKNIAYNLDLDEFVDRFSIKNKNRKKTFILDVFHDFIMYLHYYFILTNDKFRKAFNIIIIYFRYYQTLIILIIFQLQYCFYV